MEEPMPNDNNAIVNIEIEPIYLNSENNNNSETQPTKRRKKKSIVWEHFTIENVGPGVRRACCKECKQSFAYSTGSKVAGTSHLKRHIAKGGCPNVHKNRNRVDQPDPQSPNTKPITQTPKRHYQTSTNSISSFDSDRCRLEIARMVILHNYPLNIVEHPGFISFVNNLEPRYDLVNFNTVQGDVIAMYLQEKQVLQNLVDQIPGRICITLDLWKTGQTTGYVFVTGQFLDKDWKIHRKLLNVVMEPFPESDSAFSHAVSTCLSDWNLEGKLFSITVDQELTESGLESLRNLLVENNPNILGGQLLLTSCLARSLSNIVQESLKSKSTQSTVNKVRDCVKYVKTSECIEEKFLGIKQQLQIASTKSLLLDDVTQWNTTYEMLLSALELKEVLSCLDNSDQDYSKFPNIEEWKIIEVLCKYLKIFFDTTNLLTKSSIPTTNIFFHEAWKIQLELTRDATSEDPVINNITKPMRENFDKYWRKSCLILAISVVMDPRFKMKLVEFSFTKIYGDESANFINIVDEGIHQLFLEYVALPVSENGSGSGPGHGSGRAGLTDFDVYIMETTSQQAKSELDQYLEESLLPRVHEFDVIGWWKLNEGKYPTLSKMARDILVIPVSSVGPESVFEMGVKEMDRYRCSLRPETVEAVICAKDWICRENVESMNDTIKMEFPI